jgi:hypothetical protein
MEKILERRRDGDYPESHLEGQQTTGSLEEDSELREAFTVLQVAVVHIDGKISMEPPDGGGLRRLDVGLDTSRGLAAPSHFRGQRTASEAAATATKQSSANHEARFKSPPWRAWAPRTPPASL